ncbi:organelle RRM domain-containing protein 1, chloroplastic isoform X2 [Triticum urartu]|uniref:organelle RRM domain-containing protein 1, chloroplastic isoform X2 n=1 Tax=Triticum urartu TaxID=4572 RepID=UPI00204499A5|nr:organelle RRM domain-containing protein 1, chloroplastic isoform X2 [Triticum urartu]
MDAVRSLLLGGGLTVSTATGATAQATSIPHISPCSLPWATRRRFHRLAAAASPHSPLPASSTRPRCSRWVVVMDDPPEPEGGGEVSRAEAVDYYVATLARVLGSEQEAQMCIYDASWDRNYEFCCEIDEEASKKLAKMPGVLAVRMVKGDVPEKDNLSSSLSPVNLGSFSDAACNNSSSEKSEFWLVRMEKPGVEVVTKAQMVDHYTQILVKVLGNEKDAQVSIYHVSWEENYGFCCHIDEQCAKELADVPGVISVLPDSNFGSDKKDYRGDDSLKSSKATQVADVKTKRLFVTDGRCPLPCSEVLVFVSFLSKGSSINQ